MGVAFSLRVWLVRVVPFLVIFIFLLEPSLIGVAAGITGFVLMMLVVVVVLVVFIVFVMLFVFFEFRERHAQSGCDLIEYFRHHGLGEFLETLRTFIVV